MTSSVRRRAARVSLIVTSVLVTLAALEVGVRLSAGEKPKARAVPGQKAYHVIDDDVLGYRLRPSTRAPAAKIMPDGALCYDVIYTTDARGRRIVGVPPGAAARRPPLVLFGCSYTMGEGLPDRQTLAFHLGRRFEIFNYAVHGYGPQHALALLRSGRLEDDLPAGKAIGLYALYPFHLGRVKVSSENPGLWKSPYFELRGDGTLDAHPTFASAYPLRTFVYRGLRWVSERSALLGWARGRGFVEDAPDLGEITATILTEAARRFEERWQGPFIVAIEGGQWDARIPPLVRRLRENGVTVIDDTTVQRTPSDQVCAGDTHPGAAYIADMAARLEPHLLRLAVESGGSS